VQQVLLLLLLLLLLLGLVLLGHVRLTAWHY
jgi:hypothetical protein